MNKKNNNNQSHSGSTYGLEDFDHSLPISLLRAREAVMRKFIPILRSHDLSPEQWRVIRVLKLDGSLELAQLSRRCFLLAPSLSRIAQNLENREILVRTTVQGDQRRSLISLTKKEMLYLRKWLLSQANNMRPLNTYLELKISNHCMHYLISLLLLLSNND